jgi:peptide/nickel transport system substrate-binding protein
MTDPRRLSRLLTGAVLAVFALGACQPSVTPAAPAPATAEPPVPQEIVIAVPSLLSNLDAHATAGPYNGVKFAIFDTIVRTDEKGNVIPWLATSWKTVQPTVWELKLRTDVTFSNGEPLDAAAVKFSIERVINPATKSALAGRIPLVTGADTVDASTVRITTKQPDAILPARLTAIFAVPPKEVTTVGPEQFGLKPVGSGPFKVAEFVADTRIVFERNAESWRKTKVEKLTFLNLPENSTRIAALRGGQAHLIYTPPADQTAALERDGFVIAATNFARLNVFDLDVVTEDTPLKDKRVRQALNYAVDKETILKNIAGGRGRVADGQLVGPAGFGYDPTLKPYPYDPAKAKQLLAEAGYPNGFAIRMENSSGDDASRQQNLAVQGYLRDVGVNAQLDLYELNVWLDHFYARNGTKRAPIFGWAPNYFPAMDADFTLQWFISTSPKKTYSNPEFDRLYAASTVELDVQKRLGLIKQMSAIVREEAPVIFLHEPQEVWAVSKKIQGYVPQPNNEPYWEQLSITR